MPDYYAHSIFPTSAERPALLRPRTGALRVVSNCPLRTPKTLAAVQTLVTSAVAHGDVAATWTGRVVLLEMGDRIAEGFHGPRGGCGGTGLMTVAISSGAGCCFQDVGVVRDSQLRHGAVDLFFFLLGQTGDGEIRLIMMRHVRLAVAGDELHGEPAENVVGDGGRIADFRIFGEAGGFEALVCELANEGFEGHAVLEGHAGEGADAVHQAADGGTFFGHGDEKLAGLIVLEQADGEIAFVAGDLFITMRSEEHTSELQSRQYLVCRLLLEKKDIAEISR